MSMGRSWDVPGAFLRRSWDVPGTFLGRSWGVPGTFLECAWIFFFPRNHESPPAVDEPQALVSGLVLALISVSAPVWISVVLWFWFWFRSHFNS